MRVLHVTPAFAPAYVYGGPISSVEGLVVALRQSGVDVRVLTTDANGTTTLEVPRGWTTWRGVPVRYERRLRAPDLAPGILAQIPLLLRGADIVHVTALFSAPSVAAVAAAVAAGKPVVLSPKGALQPHALTLGHTRLKSASLAALKPLLKRTVLQATGEPEADAIRAVLGAPCHVVVIPNGTDVEDAEHALNRRAETSSAKARARIGALGRIHPIKGLDRLVEAVARLRAEGLDVDLELAGPTEDHAHARDLRALAGRLGLGDALTFTGQLGGPAKAQFFARCDVLCLPSHSENFGNVVVEALAAFLPVVAATGTPWQELEHAGAGRWVSNDTESLARALAPFLVDADLTADAGRRGRALVEERYTHAAVAKRQVELYRGLLASEHMAT